MATAMRTAITGFLLLLSAAGHLYASTTAGTISVAAVIPTKSVCQFDTTATSIPFGSLNPLTPTDITITSTINFTCRGSAAFGVYMITDDDGLHEAGANLPRMQKVGDTAAHLPYSLALSSTFGTVPKNTTQTITITGKVFGADYRFIPAGSYSDTVTITFIP